MADVTSARTQARRWHEYLCAFHRDTPRATQLGLELFADARGRTSYERLATTLERMPDPRRLSILDVGCGDGRLVDDVRKIVGDDATVTGVDIVPEEIARARAWGRRAEFLVADAHALDFADGSFHAVLAHFALPLMSDGPAVVAQIERVLRPSGFFAAAISSFANAREDFAALLAPFRDELARAGAAWPLPPIDDRQATPAGIAALFAAAGSRRVLRYESVPFTATVDADAAWLLLTTSYFFDALDAFARRRLRERVTALTRARGGRLRLLLTIDFVALVPLR